jgi:hypothetical protein
LIDLARGTPTQRRAALALERTQVLAVLRGYEATLVGTFPLAVDIPTSDLDILCDTRESGLDARVREAFGHEHGFSVTTKGDVRIYRFSAHGLPFEIYAAPQAVLEQPAYLHLQAELRLLELAPRARELVRAEKLRGLATEPAFARVFAIDGDPYERLARASDAELVALARSLRLA